MAGLSQVDLNILTAYASAGNRELYFNYLAQKEGNDGYGLLALGVVRNDNGPGATANCFAQDQARKNGANYDERDWQSFGVELMNNDLAMRQAQFAAKRPDLALNLPVADIQEAHDLVFEGRQINPDAWTPRQLLEAARRHGGEAEAEKAWSMMLDNDWRGVTRGYSTTERLAYRYNDEKLDAADYVASMAAARTRAGLFPTANTNPDTILLDGKEYSFQSETGAWRGPAPIESRIPVKIPVSDPGLLERLNDAREVRLEREELRTQFHPDDPNRNRPIKASPWLFTDATPTQERGAEASPAQLAQATDPRSPDHARNGLYQQCAAGVRGLDAEVGKGWDRHSECMTASLTTLAATNRLDRVDQVVLTAPSQGKAGGDHVFVVQGALDDPTHRRAHMPTAQAITTPPEQSFQQLAALDQERARAPAMQVEHAQADPARASAAMQI